MKKGLITLLVVSFVLGVAGTALAFPVDFSGDFRLQARSVDDNINSQPYKASWFQFRARLNFEGKVDDSTTFYGRVSARNNFGGSDTASSNGGAELDQYGVKLTTDNWKFNLGRQAVTLGQGTLLSTGYDAAGCTEMFDGLVATTKSGNFNLNFVGGKGSAVAGISGIIPTATAAPQSEVYGLDFSTKAGDNLTLGAAFANFHATNGMYHAHPTPQTTTRKDWAVNFIYDASPSLSFNGEYAKSNASTMNRAYFLAGTYKWDKDSFSIQYQKVQDQSVDYILSGIGVAAYPINDYRQNLWNYGQWYKGFTFDYEHQMSKTTSFHIVYMDLTPGGFSTSTGGDKELATGVVWKF